ncbi:serine hydrolase [Dietzia natronolimnaea]|uniref:Serine hydrolase n=1 Tax=Dietzia natronolimnaea TaxID=161920 RepID=A0A2A2WP38_9ACTN|nr:serine hydrolase [Dietzia natronolimnaea]
MIVVVAFGVVGAVLATLLRPGVGSIDRDTRTEGDARLAAAVLEEAPSLGVYALSVAEVTPQGTRIATVGAPLDGTVEIGSVTKPITGMLLADAMDRGELSPDTTLGEIFDLGDAASADITVEELARHRSGLPRLPFSLQGLMDSYRWLLFARNPYRDSPADVVEDVRSSSVGDKDPEYSNLGFAVLGHALAEVSGHDYPELVRTRLAEPLGLENFHVPAPGQGGAAPNAVQGRESSGRAQQAWDDAGYAPAGGIRADAASMATLLDALLAGTAPGAEAVQPVADFDDDNRIGAGWLTTELDGREITWHNGQTGGFSTWVGLDRARGTAIFISGATTRDLAPAGQQLLLRAGQDANERDDDKLDDGKLNHVSGGGR